MFALAGAKTDTDLGSGARLQKVAHNTGNMSQAYSKCLHTPTAVVDTPNMKKIEFSLLKTNGF